MRPAALRSIVSVLVLSACGSGTPKQPIDPSKLVAQPHDLRVYGDYTHPASGAVFPVQLQGMTREPPHAYDRDEYDVSGSYVTATLNVTAYVYPAGPAHSGRLSYEQHKAAAVMVMRDKALQPGPSRVLPSPAGHELGSGFERTWTTTGGTTPKLERMQVFQCGRWFLKIRATYSAERADGVDATLSALSRALSCEGIARRHPAGAQLVINLDSKQDERSAALWLTYAGGLAVWMTAHAVPSEPVYGVPDHHHEMFVAALSVTLDVYREMLTRGEPKIPAFDLLASAQDAGFLDELVWQWKLGFLAPDPQLGLDLEGYQRWSQQLPGGVALRPMSDIAYE